MEYHAVPKNEPIIECEINWHRVDRTGGHAEDRLQMFVQERHRHELLLLINRQPDKTLTIIRQRKNKRPRNPAAFPVGAGSNLIQPAGEAALCPGGIDGHKRSAEEERETQPDVSAVAHDIY